MSGNHPLKLDAIDLQTKLDQAELDRLQRKCRGVIHVVMDDPTVSPDAYLTFVEFMANTDHYGDEGGKR